MLTHTVGFCSSPRDMARIGLLLLGGGSWNGERIVSEAWLEELSASCKTNPAYGCADPLLTPSLMLWSRTVLSTRPSPPAERLSVTLQTCGG